MFKVVSLTKNYFLYHKNTIVNVLRIMKRFKEQAGMKGAKFTMQYSQLPVIAYVLNIMTFVASVDTVTVNSIII